MKNSEALTSSFRDPSGQVFRKSGVLYRQINTSYAAQFDLLMGSGLYERLLAAGHLIPHEESSLEHALTEGAHKVIQPTEIDFISYPWEWCFSQLRDAALTTLEVQKIAMEHGMVLKDASAFNIQFHRGRPVLIDTLSFEIYKEGQPWVAYRQFCQHFLAPLLLITWCDYRLIKLSRSYIDGIPLDLASRLLPKRSWLKYSVLAHVHLHARAQSRYADSEETSSPEKKVNVSKLGMTALMDSLQGIVSGLRWQQAGTEWGDYYLDTNYEQSAMADKIRLVESFLSEFSAPDQILDLGANTGRFSRLGLANGLKVVAMDIDETAIERSYLHMRDQGEENILPLVQDLSNPTPALGWHHQERMSLGERGPFKCVMALALIHHLAISNNVPLEQCAQFFADLGEFLIVEFVPKADSQVARLLKTRQDIFEQYNLEGFEKAFCRHYAIVRKEPVAGSERFLYLLSRLPAAQD